VRAIDPSARTRSPHLDGPADESTRIFLEATSPDGCCWCIRIAHAAVWLPCVQRDAVRLSGRVRELHDGATSEAAKRPLPDGLEDRLGGEHGSGHDRDEPDRECGGASLARPKMRDLSAMSRATRRLFGDERWPFQAVDTVQGMLYLMQPEIAEWWETA
jgi:hypothetical protein